MLKKLLTDCFLLAWLLVLFVDAAPLVGDWHKQLRDDLDAYLDVTGLWQGSWTLFAPDPDKINVAVSAEIIFPDDERLIWQSPKWRELSAWQRFLKFREAEFVDNIRLNQNKGAWPTLADYLYNDAVHPRNPEIKPSKIVLTRHWVLIPPPDIENIDDYPNAPEMNNRYDFFTKDYQP